MTNEGCGKELGGIEVRGVDDKPEVEVINCGETRQNLGTGEFRTFLCPECKEINKGEKEK